MSTCHYCGQEFAGSARSRYCRSSCKTEAYCERRRHRKEMARRKHCARCGLAFAATRSDAVFCSASCKQSAYRRRVTTTSCEGQVLRNRQP
jgi:hypothetical protein